MFQRVLNKKTDSIPPDAVYVGRPSKWGNPWSHKNDTVAKYRVNTLHEAILCYHEYINELCLDPEFKQMLKDELAGRDLVCWCAPDLCHASILIEIANED